VRADRPTLVACCAHAAHVTVVHLTRRGDRVAPTADATDGGSVFSQERGVLVSGFVIRRTVAGSWVGAVGAVASVLALWMTSMAPGSSAYVLAVGLVPPAVMLLVWRGAPSALLHGTERQD